MGRGTCSTAWTSQVSLLVVPNKRPFSVLIFRAKLAAKVAFFSDKESTNDLLSKLTTESKLRFNNCFFMNETCLLKENDFKRFWKMTTFALFHFSLITEIWVHSHF
jgi:hypothetical protein